MKFYTYYLCDPSSGDPRYVGCTFNPNNRIWLHWCLGVNGGKQKRLYAWKEELKSAGKEMELRIFFESEIEREAREMEKRAIAALSREYDILNSSGIEKCFMGRKGLLIRKDFPAIRKKHTLQEIGDMLGTSRQRVQQIEVEFQKHSEYSSDKSLALIKELIKSFRAIKLSDRLLTFKANYRGYRMGNSESGSKTTNVGVDLGPELFEGFTVACDQRRLGRSTQLRWLVDRLMRGEIPWGPPEPQAREQEAERGT